MSRLLFAHRHGARLVLLFDYDGTLTPIVGHPALARLGRPMARLLQNLTWQPRVRVGVVSGRSLENLRGMINLPRLYYAGLCGLEMDLLGERVIHPQAETYQGLMRSVVRHLEAVVIDFPGAWVEDKRLGLTLHYRQAARHQWPTLWEKTRQVLDSFAGLLRAVEGPLAWEIAPAAGWDKGSALRLILESIGPPVFPLYAGDGANDAEALAAVTELGGVALGIGPSAPAGVPYHLPDPMALTSFLTRLLESMSDSCLALA